jgi:transposase
VVAVGHSILVAVYYMLKEGREFEDLGDPCFDEREREYVARRAVQRLEALGYRVQLEAPAT